MESSEAFVKLREEILQHAMPLLDSDAVPADDRFRLSFQVAQTAGTPDAYRKALSIAEGLDEDSKLLAYLDLLNDVDYVIQEKQDSSRPATTQSSPRPEENRSNNGQATQSENNTQQ